MPEPTRHLRRVSTALAKVLVYLVVAGGLSLAAAVLLSRVDAGPAAGPTLAADPWTLGVNIAFSLVVCAIFLGVAAVLLRRWERRPTRALGFGLHRRWKIELGQGLALGVGLQGTIFTVYQAAGWVEVSISAGGLSLAGVGVLYLAFFAAAGASEELVCRGYPLQVLTRETGRIAATLLSAVAFGLLHLGNPGADPLSTINTGLAGIVLAVAYFRTRSLWLPTAFHLSWNWSQGVLFGFPVSGLTVEGRWLRTTATGPEWVTGGSYGPEGGAALTVVVLAAGVVLARVPWIRPAPGVVPIWEADHS